MTRHVRFCTNILLAAAALWLSSQAHAVTTNWINNSGGTFTTPANWTSGVPDSDDTAVFNRGAGVAYHVVFPGGNVFDPPPNYVIDFLRVHSNEVTFRDNSSPFISRPSLSVANPSVSIIVGENAGELAVLNTTLLSLSGSNASIGRFPSSDGTLNVAAGTFNLSGGLDVGDSGTGTLNVTGGSVSSANVNLGQFAGGQGDATVSGVNARLINSGDLTVGFAGLGQLSVTSQGFVFNNDGYIGRNAGSIGTATVTGSTWANSRNLYVGQSGTGTLDITSGGAVSVGGTTAVGAASQINVSNNGTFAGTGGNLTIDGGSFTADTNANVRFVAGTLRNGATMTVAGNASVTQSGALDLVSDVTMEISSGAKYALVDSVGAVVGTQPGPVAELNVHGIDTLLSATFAIDVGFGGTGEMRVTGGARVETNTGAVGSHSPGSMGTLTLDGTDASGNPSSWLLEFGPNMGLNPTSHGSISILNGALLRTTNMSLGESGSGQVVVDGADALGNPSLMDVGTLSIADLSSATGELTVRAGGRIEVDNVFVGHRGNGALTIESGGQISSTNARIAAISGSNGTVNVIGAGSTWTNSARIAVGGDVLNNTSGGTGTLNVDLGSSVAAQDVVIHPQGLLRLQGGTLDTPAVSFQGSGGQFQFTAGIFHVGTFSGSLVNQGGTLAPGHSAGNTTITGNYTQQQTGKLEIEIGGPTAFDHDILNVSGTASLNGELQLALINGFVPTAGQTFGIMQSGSLAGAFSNIPNGKRFVTKGGLGSFVAHYGPSSAFDPNQVRLTDFQPSPTGLVVYEPFDYSPAGADLLGANGGTGFSGSWTAGTFNHDIGTGSLSFADLNIVGNRVTSDALLAAPLGNIDRELALPLGTPGTSAYLSFVVRPEDTLHQGLFNGFFGLRLFASTGDNLFIGKPGGGALNKWVLEDQGGTQQHASGVDVIVDEEFLLVVRADFIEGNDVFTLYVNPTPGATEPLTGTVKNDSDVGIVRMLGLYSTGAFSFDELRIGTTYADVVPAGLPGDYNQNGTVDAADYALWRKSPADFGGDPDGYNTWRANFGNTLGSGSSVTAAVPPTSAIPEPTSALLFLSFAAIGLWRQRRRLAFGRAR